MIVKTLFVFSHGGQLHSVEKQSGGSRHFLFREDCKRVEINSGCIYDVREGLNKLEVEDQGK